MLCPNCGQESRVIETDKLENTVVRVRWCKNPKCRQIFETQEAVSAVIVRNPVPRAQPQVRTMGQGPRGRGQNPNRA